MGGGEARRKKKLLKECMLELLEMSVTGQKQWNKLSKLGLDPENIDNGALLTTALFMRAVESGDVAAFKEIRNLIGEDIIINNETENGIIKMPEPTAPEVGEMKSL